MADLTQFDLGSAARVARVVRAVEQEPRRTKPLAFGPVIEAGRRRAFRVCTFSGQWNINTSKVVTFKYQTSKPNTVMATNLLCGLSPNGSCDVSIAKDGAAWFLVQPNLTQQPGYSANGTQVLTIQSGYLRWVGTTAC